MSETVDLLQDVEQEIYLEPASVGQRFVNFLIDLVVFFILIFAFGFVGGFIWGEPFVYALETMNPILDRILTSLLFALYISVIEGLTKGRTLGKFITKTKAVTTYNEPITGRNSFGRGVSRIVRGEALSALGGNAWHGKWTVTEGVKVGWRLEA